MKRAIIALFFCLPLCGQRVGMAPGTSTGATTGPGSGNVSTAVTLTSGHAICGIGNAAVGLCTGLDVGATTANTLTYTGSGGVAVAPASGNVALFFADAPTSSQARFALGINGVQQWWWLDNAGNPALYDVVNSSDAISFTPATEAALFGGTITAALGSGLGTAVCETGGEFGTCASFEWMKHDISAFSRWRGFRDVMQLPTYQYTLNKGGARQVGTMEDAVARIDPLLVDHDRDKAGAMRAVGVNYQHLAAVDAAAIQAEQEEIDGLIIAALFLIAALLWRRKRVA